MSDIEVINVVRGTCAICKRETYLELTEKEAHDYMVYQLTGAFIQDCMDYADPAIREYIRDFSGHFCSDCMKKMYGHTSDRIKVVS